MAAVCSPTPLQQACEGAVASWLVQWAGRVNLLTSPDATYSRVLLTQSQNPGGENVLGGTSRSQANPFLFNGNTDGSSQQERHTLQSAVTRSERVMNTQKQHCRCLSHRKTLGQMIQYEEPSQESTRTTPKEVICDTNMHSLISTDDPPPNHPWPIQIKNRSPNRPSVDSLNQDCKKLMAGNIKICSSFLELHVPPILLKQIIHTAWQMVSLPVSLGGRLESVTEYEVKEWARCAPVILKLSAALSQQTFQLDISGIPNFFLSEALVKMCSEFPCKSIHKLVLPRPRFKHAEDVPLYFQDQFLEFLRTSNLQSLTVHSELCNNHTLSTISNMSLQELDIGGSAATEDGVLKFCKLPFATCKEATETLRDIGYTSHEPSPLMHSLRKLSIAFHNIPSSVYHIIPACFPHLTFYNPPRDIKICIRESQRLKLSSLISNESCQVNSCKDNLLTLNLGQATRLEILEMSTACPMVRKVTLRIELNSEDTLTALESFHHLSDLTLIYYPSMASSPPKINGNSVLPTLKAFRHQLRSLSLTGINILDKTFWEISFLPKLKSLSLTDCWMSNPKLTYEDPFPSLENLYLQFLPPNTIMQLLTASKSIHHIEFNFAASEWEGNAVSDSYIKDLITSGRINALKTFIARSPCLTLASIKSMTLLPSLRTVGYLGRWGLSTEELKCISHSGPPHLLYMH